MNRKLKVAAAAFTVAAAFGAGYVWAQTAVSTGRTIYIGEATS